MEKLIEHLVLWFYTNGEPSNSADDVSGAAVASLLAQSALTLASRDRRDIVLQRAEIVLWSETILASYETE